MSKQQNSKKQNNKTFRAGGLSPEKLLSTEKIINLARIWGVDFGPGNPNERIRYFIKLGLLPHQTRKRPETSNQAPGIRDQKPETRHQRPDSPVGHLPYWTVKRLIEIDGLYKKGLSYPQISKRLKGSSNLIVSSSQKKQVSANKTPSTANDEPTTDFLSQMGLSHKEIKDQLEKHKLDIEERLDGHRKEIQDILNASTETSKVGPWVGAKTSSAPTSPISESDLKNINKYQTLLKIR